MNESTTELKSKQVRGSDLQCGDTIRVWWRPNADTITKLAPYKGPLAHLWPKGARIASFAVSKVGMTIDCTDWFEVLNRANKRKATSMSYYGEEFGDTYKQVKLQDLKKVMTKLRAEERSRRKAAAESKHQAQAEWHSATAAGINYALALLDVLAKKAL